MVQVQDSISKRLHHHTFSNMLFNMISKAHHVRIFSCFGPRVDTWLTTRPIFPTFWLSSLVFFHSTSYATWITPSLNCRHPLMCVHTSHWPYEYPPPTLCSWQRMHWNLWCNSWHLCHHCKRCWFPRGMITITCVSFNHIQLVLLTNQHHVYQKWHLHPSRCCHYWPNTSGFTSPTLHNSKICYLWCSSSPKNELSQLTPHWLIPPLCNWGIWLLAQTCWCVFTQLCHCHLELERAKKPSSFYLGIFFC